VARALHHLAIRVKSSNASRVLAPGTVGAQVVLAEPVPHCGLAEPEPLRDLASREAFGDQSLQGVAIDPSFGRVPVAMNRRKAVTLHPVADGRGIAPSEPPDAVK